MASLFGPGPTFVPQRIVSGGQTGVDRAALDIAINLKIEHGGWCPAGRLSEDGTIPASYSLTETRSREYPVRTEQNVSDSNATLILYEGKLKGGSLLTLRICRRLEKPHFALAFDCHAVDRARAWLTQHQPNTLNIAGPRESSCPGIHVRCTEFLLRTFSFN
jgi:hypothetical protein